MNEELQEILIRIMMFLLSFQMCVAMLGIQVGFCNGLIFKENLHLRLIFLLFDGKDMNIQLCNMVLDQLTPIYDVLLCIFLYMSNFSC